MAATKQTTMKTKLRRVLREAFDGAQVELEPWGTAKIGGSLIWRGFAGLDQIDRQRALRGVLKHRLDENELLRVSSILTFTPHEVAVMDRETNGR